MATIERFCQLSADFVAEVGDGKIETTASMS